jgi:hypothetical protein
MNSAPAWVKLLGLAAASLLIAVAMPPAIVWLARLMLIVGAISALLAAKAYFELSIITGEKKPKSDGADCGVGFVSTLPPRQACRPCPPGALTQKLTVSAS